MPKATFRRENPGGVTATITSPRVVADITVGYGGRIDPTLKIGTAGDR